MKQAQVTAQVPERKDPSGKVVQKAIGPISITVPFPETLDEAKKWCSEEAILSNAFANGRVVIQSGMRTAMKAGKSAQQIQEQFSSWVLGVATAGGRVDPQQAFIAKFRSASKEEQAKMLAELKQAAAG